MKRVLVVQTAFPGDVVLTLPLIQVLHECLPGTEVVGLTTPAAANLLEHHPAVARRIGYDKRGADRGLSGFLRVRGELRASPFDAAVIPHRSFRSAALCAAAGIPRRIGFTTSAGRTLLTDLVPYNRDAHEIRRNLDLLGPLGIPVEGTPLPRLHPGPSEREAAEPYLRGLRAGARPIIALAPGSVWATKRWPEAKFESLARLLQAGGNAVVLVGGPDDEELCSRIAVSAGGAFIRTAAGRLSLLASAALLQQCDVLVSNDSAPMHLAVAVATPVVAIFGATSPAFGFAPRGSRDTVLETRGLPCRPCAIHGGPRCPVRTFDCMERIDPEDVMRALRTYGAGEVSP